jgi:hypothetical protein
MTETEIKLKGMEVLTQSLGLVEAERFVSLMLREPFDYTAWRQSLFPGLTVAQIHEMATREYRKNG